MLLGIYKAVQRSEYIHLLLLFFTYNDGTKKCAKTLYRND